MWVYADLLVLWVLGGPTRTYADPCGPMWTYAGL